MIILINISNPYAREGLQVGLSSYDDISNAINFQINEVLFSSNFQFYLIENLPSSLKTRRCIKNRMFIK